MDGSRLIEKLETELRDVMRVDGVVLAASGQVHDVPTPDVRDVLLRLDSVSMARDKVVEETLPDCLVADGQLADVQPLHDGAEHDRGRQQQIGELTVSDKAIREGLLYDFIARH